jgi:hypothetical protein
MEVKAIKAWCTKNDLLLVPAKAVLYGGKRYGSSMPTGFPDFLLLEPHHSTKRLLAIELKVGDDKLGPEQVKCIARLAKRGISYAATTAPPLRLPCPDTLCCTVQDNGGHELRRLQGYRAQVGRPA